MHETTTAAGNQADTPIERRDIHFAVADCGMRDWHPQGVQVTQFFNALSVFFPEGEKFFIESVRHYRDRITDPTLQAEVGGFIGQEAMHSREHRDYNQALEDAGFGAHKLEERVIHHLNIARRRLPPAARLAITIALEHFTAIMADELLSNDRVLAGADPRMAQIWRWHAIEETEHKAVAYDVYQQQVGGGLGGYLLRVTMMLETSLLFWLFVYSYHLRFVKRAGVLGDLRGWLRALKFLWVTPGTLRRIIPAYLRYYRPGFHPWQHDNRHHVERWKAAYEETGKPPF